MFRRFTVFSLSILIALAIGASPAFGWANGADLNGDGEGDDGYGTHDWVLDQALRLAGESGSWVVTDIARLATDDPDGISDPNEVYKHLFQNTVKGQGAPQAVADLYASIAEAHKQGDYEKASRELGWLSHYYSDICQPYHTWYDAADQPEHLYYEYTVDDYHRSATDNESWITPVARKPVTDIREMTVSAALAARGDYSALRTAWVPGPNGDSHGNFNPSSSSTIGAITRRRLSRAANDLADIIATIPTGQGKAPTVNITSLSTYRRYVGQTSNVAAYAKVRDANGDPVQGVRVTYTWAFSSGPKEVFTFTDSTGLATLYQNMGGEKLWYKVDLTAKASTNGTESVRSEWVMPTPLIGYIKTSMSNTRPRQGTVVTAKTKILDSKGKPIKGLKVTFSWKFKSSTYYSTTYTNSYGNAYSKKNIGRAAKGYRVYVRAQTQSANYNRSSTSSFIPQ